MKIKAVGQQVQKQLLAPTMQQSIEVLLLPIMDLSMSIRQELENNPLLELIEDKQDSSVTSLEDTIFQRLEKIQPNQEVPFSWQSNDDEMSNERPIKNETSLEENLLRQLRIEFTDLREIQIGEIVVGNLNEDGYLTATNEEIAQASRIDDLELVEQVIKKIQNFEPIGIASRDIKECLLAQIATKCNGNGELVMKIITDYLKELGAKKFQLIARKLGVGIEDVKEASRMIGFFEPKPARNYQPISANLYVKPDVFIVRENDDTFKINVNKEGIPLLRINAFYKRMLKQGKLTNEEKEFIREKLKNALYFIKSIDQRGQTIRRIAEYILEKQKNFFKDEENALVPMTLKDVAHAIERNESTISRAISTKYIDTPKGLYPIKFFFSQGVNESTNGAIASRSIKGEIRNLIEAEDKSSPLSDHDIQMHFEKKGMKIARRTISKYRQGMRILPSHLRKS